MTVLLKMKFKKEYVNLESHFRARGDLLKIMGLCEDPSKSIVGHASKKCLNHT